MMNILGILLGGGIGALLRYFITKLVSERNPHNKHIGTFLVNVIGSFSLGYVYACSSAHCSLLYKTLVIGIIASFTTYSSYEFDNLTLIAAQRYREFFKYSFGSCFICLVSLYLGMLIVTIS